MKGPFSSVGTFEQKVVGISPKHQQAAQQCCIVYVQFKPTADLPDGAWGPLGIRTLRLKV